MRAAELVARAGHPLAARALMARRGKNDRRDFISRSGARAGCAFVHEPLGLAQHPAGDGPSRTMAKPRRDAGDLARWLPLEPPAADSTGIVFCATVFKEAISKPKQPSTARSAGGALLLVGAGMRSRQHPTHPCAVGRGDARVYGVDHCVVASRMAARHAPDTCDRIFVRRAGRSECMTGLLVVESFHVRRVRDVAPGVGVRA